MRCILLFISMFSVLCLSAQNGKKCMPIFMVYVIPVSTMVSWGVGKCMQIPKIKYRQEDFVL